MIVIQQYVSSDCTDGLRVDIDSDRAIAIHDNKGGYWIEFKNGGMVRSVAISHESAEALAFLLRHKLAGRDD